MTDVFIDVEVQYDGWTVNLNDCDFSDDSASEFMSGLMINLVHRADIYLNPININYLCVLLKKYRNIFSGKEFFININNVDVQIHYTSIKPLLDAITSINNIVVKISVKNVVILRELISGESNFVNKINTLIVYPDPDTDFEFINYLPYLHCVKLIGSDSTTLTDWAHLFDSHIQKLNIKKMNIVFSNDTHILNNCKIAIIKITQCNIYNSSMLGNLGTYIKILNLTNNIYDEPFDENILTKKFDAISIDANFCLSNNLHFGCSVISIYFGTNADQNLIQHLLNSNDIKSLTMCFNVESQVLSYLEMYHNKDIVYENFCFIINSFEYKQIDDNFFNKLFTVTSNLKIKNLHIKSNWKTKPKILETFLSIYYNNEYLETLDFYTINDLCSKCVFDDKVIEQFCSGYNILTDIFVTTDRISVTLLNLYASLEKLFTKFSDNKLTISDRLYKKTKPITQT
jgi:hypothetical protein